MIATFRPFDGPGSLLEAQRAAQALADYLADPKHLAELARTPGVEIGLASVEPVRAYHITARLDEAGRLFVIGTELEGPQ